MNLEDIQEDIKNEMLFEPLNHDTMDKGVQIIQRYISPAVVTYDMSKQQTNKLTYMVNGITLTFDIGD